MNDLISVIVPVYKVEKYLDLCVTTLIRQTYTNLEIFLVDDGSPDNCGKICDSYAAKDTRIRVIHKENGGLSDARNAAMKLAKGTYVAFVDSDDFVDIHYIEYLYESLKTSNADIATCGWRDVLENERELPVDLVYDAKETVIWNKREAFDAILYQVPIDSHVWGALFPLKFFEGIEFPYRKLYEDLAVMYRIYDQAEKVCYNPYQGYQYLLRDTGICLQKFSAGKMDLIDFADEMKAYMLEKYPELSNAVWSRFFRANCHVYLQIPSDAEYADYRRRIEKNLRMSRGKVLTDPKTRRGTKAAAILTYLGFPVFRAARRWKGMGRK